VVQVLQNRAACGAGATEQGGMWCSCYRTGQHVVQLLQNRAACGAVATEQGSMWCSCYRTGQHVVQLLQNRAACGAAATEQNWKGAVHVAGPQAFFAHWNSACIDISLR